MEKGIRKMVSEELYKIIREDFDYSSEEVAYSDGQDLEREEAAISTALSFIQDIQGSANKLRDQKKLNSTTPSVDGHIEEAVNHINKAIENYFETLSPGVKSQVMDRMGEVKID